MIRNDSRKLSGSVGLALLAVVVLLGLIPLLVEAGDYQPHYLPLSSSFSHYRVGVENDTINLMTNHHPHLTLCRFYDDTLISKEYLTNEEADWGWNPSFRLEPWIEAIYATDSTTLLWSDRPGSPSQETNLPIKPTIGSFSGYLFPLSDKDLIVNTKGEDRFAISSHNLNEEYSNWQSYTVSDGKVEGPTPIQTGRHKVYSLHSAELHDTVFIAWEQYNDKAVLSAVKKRLRSIEFAYYDGTAWSEPVSVLRDSISAWDANDDERRILGLYRINGKLFLFWYLRGEGDAPYRISYRYTEDLINWSVERPLPVTRQYQGENGKATNGFYWKAGNIPDSTLHLILRTDEHPMTSYYTFDAEGLTFRGELGEGPKREFSFAFDQDHCYLFCLLGEEIERAADSTDTGEESITRDTVSSEDKMYVFPPPPPPTPDKYRWSLVYFKL